MNSRVSNISLRKIEKEEVYSAFSKLFDLKPISSYTQIDIGLSVFCINMSLFYVYSGLNDNNNDYEIWGDASKFSCKLLEEGEVSKYQISRLKNISQVLCEAKELHETKILSDAEFLEVIQTVKETLLRKFDAIKKRYLKNKIAEKGLNKNSLVKLRAKVATLQNEN